MGEVVMVNGAGARGDATLSAPPEPPLIQALRTLLGPAQVITDADVTTGFTTDWTGRFGGPALAVVKPSSTEEISETIRLCTAHSVPVIPQGGNTGLVGGSVPNRSGEPPVILSTTRLRRLDPVDAAAAQVTVGAGITLAEVQAHARASGLEYGVDIAARDSATIGGTLATNAGGMRVCLFGTTRAQVVGVEAVLADGSVISDLAGLEKDNTGYDLSGLLIGSEGTLGIITAARLRLHQPMPASLLALLPVATLGEAVGLVRMQREGSLLAAEVLDARSLGLVRRHAGLSDPFPGSSADWLLLMEVTEDDIAIPDGLDPVVAESPADKQRLWAYRERLTESYAAEAAGRGTVVHKADVSIPFDQLDAYVGALQGIELGDGFVGLFGHVAEGNLHVEIIGPGPQDDTAVEEALRLAAEHGGSISAEHGVGRAKSGLLQLCRSTAELVAMRAIKGALDPAGTLNPGVILG